MTSTVYITAPARPATRQTPLGQSITGYSSLTLLIVMVILVVTKSVLSHTSMRPAITDTIANRLATQNAFLHNMDNAIWWTLGIGAALGILWCIRSCMRLGA